MTGKTHQIIGQTVGLTTYFALAGSDYNPATFAFAVVVSSVAALLPDIDQSSSSLWRAIPFGRVAGKVVDPFIKHRNLSHSIVGTAIAFGIVSYLTARLPNYWGVNGDIVLWVFLTSYVSHLIADMVTVEGIPLLFPYQRMFGVPPRPFHAVRIVTGKWFENWVVFPIVNIALLVVIFSHWARIHLILFR